MPNVPRNKDGVAPGNTRPARIRRRKRRDSSKSTADLVLEEAESLIAEHGVDGLRLGDISKRLGVSVAALYQHYPRGRDEILERLGMEPVAELARLFAISGDDPVGDLVAGVRGLVDMLVTRPGLARLMLRDLSMPEGLPQITRRIGRPGVAAEQGVLKPMHDRLRSLLRSASAQGQARDVDPAMFYNVLLGASLVTLVYPPGKKPRTAVNPRRGLVEAAVVDAVLAFIGCSERRGHAGARGRSRRTGKR